MGSGPSLFSSRRNTARSTATARPTTNRPKPTPSGATYREYKRNSADPISETHRDLIVINGDFDGGLQLHVVRRKFPPQEDLLDKRYPRDYPTQFVENEEDIHRRMTALSNSNILHFLGRETTEKFDHLYFSCPASGTLDALIQKERRLDLKTAHTLFCQLTSAVAFLHGQRICHRDLNPMNLFLDGREILKVGNFWRAAYYRREGEEDTVFSGPVGKLSYCAIECLVKPRRYKGPPIDVWACALVLVEMITGEHPWDKGAIRKGKKTKNYKLWLTFRMRAFNVLLWTQIPEDAMEVIKMMLDEDPKTRMGIGGVRESQWFLQKFDGSVKP